MTSPGQDGLWVLSGLSPDSPVHNNCRAFAVTGPLRLDALRAAWWTLLRRHDTLRTTFTEVDGRPLAHIGDADADSWVAIDLTDAGPHDRRERAERLCDEAAASVADLGTGPLARLTVVTLSRTDHLVVLVAHEAIADDRSLSIMVDDLSACYAGTGQQLPPAPRYADYARWARAYTTTVDYQADRDWWSAAMAEPPPRLSLAVDRPRSTGAWWQGGVVRWQADDRVSLDLRHLCRAEATTPFVVLLAAYQCLLSRQCGQRRVAVGASVSVRPRPDFTRVVGPCADLLVLVGDLSGEPTFREYVRRVAALTRSASRHKQFGLSELVRTVNPDRDPRRIPWCEARFVYPDWPAATLTLPGARVRAIPVHHGGAAAEITLTIDEVAPTLTGSLEYRRGVIGADAAALLVEQLGTLLASAVRDPDVAVHALALDGPQRVRSGVAAADRIADAVASHQPVHALVRRQTRPDLPAVLGRDGVMSYRELDRAVTVFAGRLHRAGGLDGAAVAVRMAVGARQVVVSLAALRVGAHLVWFGTGDTGERGRQVLTDLAPAALIVDGDPDGDELTRWFRDERGGRVIDAVTPDRGVPGGAPAVHIGADRTAYVAFTSGSTGRPKGVAHSHATFGQFVTWMAAEFGLGPGSRVASWVSPEHDPSLCEVFATLVSGATLCPVPDRIRSHPEKFVDWLVAQRITFLQTVPSFARELLAVIERADRDGGDARRGRVGSLVSLDRLVLMGEALPADLAAGLRTVLPGTRLINVYGPTETIAATWHEITTVTDPVPIGRPIPGRHLLLLDEYDRPCPTGVTGQIVIRSPYVAAGYLDDDAPAAFRPVVDDDGVRCYRTGDLGRRRADGLWEFRGRVDHQVKLLGTRVELAEVEAVLAEHESVAECAVLAPADADGLVTRLVAYVVPRTEGADASAVAAGWRTHLRQRFGPLPVSLLSLPDGLPRNLAGKVDRQRLPDSRPDRDPADPAVLGPRTSAQRVLAAIWSELLDPVPTDGGSIPADQTFFGAGGHSLLLPRLATLIRERFGVPVPMRDLVEAPSLAEMSTVVQARTAPDNSRTRWSEKR